MTRSVITPHFSVMGSIIGPTPVLLRVANRFRACEPGNPTAAVLVHKPPSGAVNRSQCSVVSRVTVYRVNVAT